MLRKALKISLVDSVQAAKAACASLATQEVIGFDSEGVNLSRFGKVALLQFRSSNNLYVCDAMVSGVVGSFREILESEKITKIAHDCREDLSALLHEHKISVHNIFDTQLAFKHMMGHSHVSSLQTVKAALLGRPKNTSVLMNEDTWLRRPLGRDQVLYAAGDVADSLELFEKLKDVEKARDGSLQGELRRYVDYRVMNTKIRRKQDLRPGERVRAMLASNSSPYGWYFKLNCGVPGIVSGLENLARIHDVKVGDVIECVVASFTPLKDAVVLDP